MSDTGLILMRRDLDGIDAIEKRMFGGTTFMVSGNMLCGAHDTRLYYRVGKPRMDKALALNRVQPFRAGAGRPMGGMVQIGSDAMSDDDLRHKLLVLALDNVRELPPK